VLVEIDAAAGRRSSLRGGGKLRLHQRKIADRRDLVFEAAPGPLSRARGDGRALGGLGLGPRLASGRRAGVAASAERRSPPATGQRRLLWLLLGRAGLRLR
jgi:hypothetical protein